MIRKNHACGTVTDADVVITEVGGTVGDIESLPFLEALRQMRSEVRKRKRRLYSHDARSLPSCSRRNEDETNNDTALKNLALRSTEYFGHVRTEKPISESMRNKIANFCDVEPEAVIESMDVDTLYQIPLNLQAQHMDEIVCGMLHLDTPQADMTDWQSLCKRVRNLEGEVKIALVGKYVQLPDAYISVNEALKHAGYKINANVKIDYFSL